MTDRGRDVSIRGAVLLLSVYAWSHSSLADPFLVKDGKAVAQIVVAENPPRMAKLAAGELQTYVAKMTGATLPIVTAPSADCPAQVYVGRSAYTDRLEVTDDGLRHGAYRMVSGYNHLVLLGRDSDFTPPKPFLRGFSDMARLMAEWDEVTGQKWAFPYTQLWKGYSRDLGLWEKDGRGSLNAVYDFLRAQGVRWYLPHELGEIVPNTHTIALPQVDKTVRPDFALRYPYQYFRRFGCRPERPAPVSLRGLAHEPEHHGRGRAC